MLDKLAAATFPLVPLEEGELYHEEYVGKMQEIWRLLTQLGFGVIGNDRVSHAVEQELLQLASFLSLIKARDSARRTVLMLACRLAHNAAHEGMVR